MPHPAVPRGGDPHTCRVVVQVVEVEGKPARSSLEILNFIAARKPGEVLTFTVDRSGEKHDIKITVAERPAKGR